VTHTRHSACHTGPVPPTQPGTSYVPTLYKARRVPTKQAVCAICVERTRGRTQEVHLGYGVAVWLCAAHASREFQTQRSGRDLVLTLQRLWKAHGCLTEARHKALRAHLAALRGPHARPRPGSYSWPTLRTEAERRVAAGARPETVIAALRSRHAADTARAPSIRTMRRWCAERRWLARPP
jgi:hypothetical protein